jgi:hypothetical protein
LSSMPLEPVSLGQGRTHCPGLSADERGVIMGRRLALFFPDLARAVGFFRAYSREGSLDDVFASLQIQEAQSERGGRELMVRFDVQNSYAGDRAAQAARQHRGRAFTGSEQHFVPFRDRKSPLGYDLSAAEDVVVDVVDLVLYSEAGVDRRKLGRSVLLRDLILGLSPRPLTESERQQEVADTLVVRCEQGLAEALVRYLWSRQVKAKVSSALGSRRSLFDGQPRQVRLFRCEGIPRHVAQLVAGTPGMRVFLPAGSNLLVEWGFRHPIALESCGAAFDDDEMILFYGDRAVGTHRGSRSKATAAATSTGVPAASAPTERLAIKDDAIDIADLVEVTVRGSDGVIPAPALAAVTGIEALDVELRLARLPRASASTTALLIGHDRLPWFQKLVYLLPAAILRTYEALVTDEHIIVVNRRGVHGIPFGEPMTELYPQIFCPVGMGLLPRVDYDLLREHLQIQPEQNLTFFREHGAPFAVPAAALRPLSRAVVAPERAKASIVELATRPLVEELAPPTVQHGRQGVFSLWRGTAVDDREASGNKALPPRSTPALPPAPEARSVEDGENDGG